MSDTFTAPASQNIDNAQAQALQAVAQSGSAGKAAMDQAAQANAASKTAALKDAMAYAALRGAPQGNVNAGQGVVAAPYNDRAATLAGLAANYAANNQAMQAANTGFFAGAKAGLPAVKGMLDQKVAGLQQASAMRQAALQAQMQSRANADNLAALRLQLEQQRLDAANNKQLTPAEIIARAFGPAATAGDVAGGYVSQAQGAMNAQNSADHSVDMSLPGNVRSQHRDDLGAGIPAPTTADEGASAVDRALNLPPGTTAGLTSDTATKDAQQQAALGAANQRASNITPEQVRNATDYPKALSDATNQLNAGKADAGTIAANLANTYHIPPDAAYVILSDAQAFKTRSGH